MEKMRNEKQQNKSEQKKISRRQFLGIAAGVGVAAAGSGCDVVDIPDGSGWLPTQYHNSGNVPASVKGRVPIDPKNPSIVRDDKACILCGQCLDVCQNVETVYNYLFACIAASARCIVSAARFVNAVILNL